MFDCLVDYVAEQRQQNGSNGAWDGNVPANYKTHDNRALGRWVNRQRSAFHKNKLKKDLVDKLNNLGLKWAVHSRADEMDWTLAASNAVATVSAASNTTTTKCNETENVNVTSTSTPSSTSSSVKDPPPPVTTSTNENVATTTTVTADEVPSNVIVAQV
jgi:Helicase associated domain